MKILYENVSLRTLTTNILAGLVEYENPEDILIYSEKISDVYVKLIEIDMTEYIKKFVGTSEKLKTSIKHLEVNNFDFVVFTTVDSEEDQSKTLICSSLFELVSVENLVESNLWSLDNNIWTLSLVSR